MIPAAPEHILVLDSPHSPTEARVILTETEITNERLEAQIRDLEQRKKSITLRQKVDRLEQELLELEQQ